MTIEKAFKQLVSQYCKFSPAELTGEKRFREDLDFSSLDFMSFLGELEDEFDVELEQDKIIQIHTIDEALSMIRKLQEVC
ncbi:acyl carrier protein [Pseudobutyrivibrio xylanivorans]|uniref:Acyl carrier protein n=1 Tax=Pseudobutyrivibrio xylanivorans DSM 14809 TaxID=1123012 RepID=A0A1M6L681_PSEXY|nr:phosphopantetheine-binding protein [Pseudobutyrivibrio xylanivorans]SHJ66696.1 acyl carrier protein [Pseudobutyrivibrio xylanivorans DSM 14809]